MKTKNWFFKIYNYTLHILKMFYKVFIKIMKKIILLISMLLLLPILSVSSYYKYADNNPCYEMWFNAYSYWDWMCACKPWYHFEKNYEWKLICVKAQTCSNRFWSNSIQDEHWNCVCKPWYMFYTDPNWGSYCIDGKKHCEFIYWDNWLYNDFSKSCACKYWYELSLDIYNAWYICRSCNSKYWANSYFDDSIWACACKDWYFLKDWRCRLIEYDSHFYLHKYEWVNDVTVISYDTKKAYKLKLQSTNKSYEVKDYVWKKVTINLRNNNKLDVGDIFKLEYRGDITWINLKILKVQEIKFKFDDYFCKKSYWKYSYLWKNDNCICKDWYELNWDETECVWKTIKWIEYYNNYYDSLPKNKNSIFDTSDLFLR